MKELLALTLLLLLNGCSRSPGLLGAFAPGPVLSIGAVRSAATAQAVNVKGTLVEKCPVAGCWFYLQDESGRIKVDTKTAGFVVLDVPVGTKVEVSGTVLRDGNEALLGAQGLKF